MIGNGASASVACPRLPALLTARVPQRSVAVPCAQVFSSMRYTRPKPAECTAPRFLRDATVSRRTQPDLVNSPRPIGFCSGAALLLLLVHRYCWCTATAGAPPHYGPPRPDPGGHDRPVSLGFSREPPTSILEP
jgi:hypothetical protein